MRRAPDLGQQRTDAVGRELVAGKDLVDGIQVEPGAIESDRERVGQEVRERDRDRVRLQTIDEVVEDLAHVRVRGAARRIRRAAGEDRLEFLTQPASVVKARQMLRALTGVDDRAADTAREQTHVREPKDSVGRECD